MLRRLAMAGAAVAVVVGGVTAAAAAPASAVPVPIPCSVFQYDIVDYGNATDAPSGGNVLFYVVPGDVINVDNRNHNPRYGGHIYDRARNPLGYGWVLQEKLRYNGHCW